MLELLILVAAVVLLAIVLRPVLEWIQWVEQERAWERDWRRRQEQQAIADLYAGFAVRQPSTHAIITGITS